MTLRRALLSVSLLTLLIAPTACGEDTPAGEGLCRDLTILGARGSGEDADSSTPRGFGTQAAVQAQAVMRAAADPPFEWDTETYGIDYPAVEFGRAQAAPQELVSSVEAGVDDAVAFTRTRVEECPGTRFVLIGMSQGALVAHGWAARVSREADLVAVRDRTLGVVLLGDPARDRDDTEVENADLGGVADSHGVLATSALDISPSLTGRVLSVCVVGDSVCSAPRGTTWENLQITEPHLLGYVTEEATAAVLGWLGSRDPLVG